MAAEDVKKAHSTPCKLRVLVREITAFVNRVLEPRGLTHHDAELLYHLREGLVRPSAIAEAMGVDPSVLSRLIRAFEQQGWVERHVDESNRTRVELSLTEAGLAEAVALDPHAAAVHAAVDGALSAEELRGFHGAMEAIAASLDRAGTPPEGERSA